MSSRTGRTGSQQGWWIESLRAARPSVRSENARAKLDHAIAVFVEANRRTSEKLGEAAASGDGAAQPATESALAATAQSSIDITAVIDSSEGRDAPVPRSAGSNSSGGGTTTLGELASASSSATTAVAARAR